MVLSMLGKRVTEISNVLGNQGELGEEAMMSDENLKQMKRN